MRKEYENLRIVSIDGSTIVKHVSPSNYTAPLCTVKNGKLDRNKFGGIIDKSLDIEKLEEVYEKHENEFQFPFVESDNFTRALVNVSFAYVIREYERYGQRYVKWGCVVTDEDMHDHICVRNGILIAIEVPYENDREYAPVENPLDHAVLGKYFAYDESEKAYKLSQKDIPVVLDKKDIRQNLYKDGFYMDGMHYVRYKRSAGSSREGQCLFIAEPLFADMMSWSACGLSVDNISDQASWQAYIALTLSSVEKIIELPKKAILIIPDRESVFRTKAVCVREDSEEGLSAAEEVTTVRNNIFDGEALMDSSVFEANGYPENSMMLLRNRFFKTCAFNTKLDQWFKDNRITEIRQLGGYTTARKVEDIKLVITESSLKYLKFMPKGSSYADGFKTWVDALYEGKNTSKFGVVKTDKPPKHMDGLMAYTNYQLLNTLPLVQDGIDKFLEQSTNLLKQMQQDSMYMRYYIKSVSYEVPRSLQDVDVENYRRKLILDMLSLSPDFEKTRMYKDFRAETCTHFKDKLISGRVLVDGNYEVLFGNPYEFLMATIDKHYRPTEPMLLGEGEIYTKRFKAGAKLMCARSPHITMGNVYLAENKPCKEIDKYFKLNSNIVCVNAIKSNLQQRLNGCDYDSDTMLVTNNPLLVQSAKRMYHLLDVPVCLVEPCGAAEYTDSPESLASLDIKIAENKIGEIINLSQFLNSMLWDRLADENSEDGQISLYYDICKLAVMSGMEIDKAKRLYPVDATKLLNCLKKYREGYKKAHGSLPNFYLCLTDKKLTANNTAKLNTPLSYVYDNITSYPYRAPRSKDLPLVELFDFATNDDDGNDGHRKDAIISAVIAAGIKLRKINQDAHDADEDIKNALYAEANRIFEECFKKVSKKIKSDHVLYLILKELEKKDSKYKIRMHASLLLAMLIYEPNARLTQRIKNFGNYQCENLKYYDKDKDENYDPSINYEIRYVYDHPHRVMHVQKMELDN